MTDRYEQKKKRPWLQYVTLGIATLAMAFSAIAAFHPFGLGETSRPNMTQQTGGFGGGNGGPMGGYGNQSQSNSIDDAAASSATTQ